jgi:Predicted membrane protein (DUF2306)
LWWVFVVLLAAIGVLSAVNRAVVVTGSMSSPPSSELTRSDQQSVRLLGRLLKLDPEGRRITEVEEDLLTASQKYNSQPLATLLHILPGALFLVVAPIQLVGGIRSRHLGLHRWTGRLLLLMALPLALAGLSLAVRSPASGLAGGAASVAFGVLFIVSGTQGFRAVRRRDLVRHREWMLRLVAVAYGITIVRVIDMALIAITTVRPLRLAGPSLWAGWLLSVGAAEWWIRRTRLHGRSVT